MNDSRTSKREDSDTAVDLLQYDLATVEKLPVLRRLLERALSEPALDVGSGTGHLTAAAFEGRRPIAIDSWLPNLRAIGAEFGEGIRLVHATGATLPLKSSSIGVALCSEVLEHVDDDAAVVAEIARVLRPRGYVVITVPTILFGVDTYLRLFRIRTVHDHPGPEQHVRRGYREADLRRLLEGVGLEIEELVYVFRPFSKLAIDTVALAHLLYERVVNRRTSWTWDDVAGSEMQQSRAFQAYRTVFPLLRALGALDSLFGLRRGFGIALRARRAGE